MRNVHPTAVVSDGAHIGEGARVGAYCVIGPEVSIGSGCCIEPHTVIAGRTEIGADCKVFSFSAVGTQTQDLKFKGGTNRVVIGDRVTIREYVTINSGTNETEVTRIGDDALIMAYCHIAHGCAVGRGVIMANGATLGGLVSVGDFAVLGGLTGVHQFVRIGTMAMVGACSKLVQDCPPYMIVDGNPAKVRGANLVGMRRRGVDPDVAAMFKRIYRTLYRCGLSTSQALERMGSEIEPCSERDYFLRFVEESARGIVK